MPHRALPAALLLLPAVAAAEVQGEAQRVQRDDLGDLLWSAVVSCDGRAGDLARRQCRLVRDARAQAWAGRTFVIRLDDGAVAGGVIRGCLACAHRVSVDGQAVAVVTRGSVSEGPEGEVVGPELGPTPAGAIPGPVDLVFRLPPTPEAWSQGATRGFMVEALSWRPIVAPATAGATPQEEALPEQLTREQIKTVMTPVATQVDICYESFGIPGTADLGFELGGDGIVKHAEVQGDLAGTPTASCITQAVMKASFPRFKRKTMWIHYPFTLR